MAIQAEWCSENPGFVLDNACVGGGLDAFNGLCYNNPPLQQQQHQFQFLQQKVAIDHNFGNMGPMQMYPHQQQQVVRNFPLNLAAELEKHKLDMDRFICLQNERLRFGLQEQRKEQVGLMLRRYEAKAQVALEKKDEEIREAMKKRVELETFLKRLETEKLTWQRAAKEKEAMLASLTNTFERLRESACNNVAGAGGAEDAESCCDDRHDDDDQLGNKNKQQGGGRTMVCKSCNIRSSGIVFLPCRHLCCCKTCEPYLHSCPVCTITKKAIIEAML